MFIRKSVSAAALGGILVWAKDGALAGLSKEGPLLVADLTGTGDWGMAEQMAVVDGWENYVGGLIADADDNNDIAALSALKQAIADLRQDVTREHYMRDASEKPAIDIAAVYAEASEGDAGSHPTSTGDATISNASQQHGADSEQIEENDNEQAHEASAEADDQQPRQRRRRG